MKNLSVDEIKKRARRVNMNPQAVGSRVARLQAAAAKLKNLLPAMAEAVRENPNT